MDTWEKHILNRGEESTSDAALVYFEFRCFSILWKFSLGNKNFSGEINSTGADPGLIWGSYKILQKIVHWNDVICRKVIDSARSKKVQFWLQ